MDVLNEKKNPEFLDIFYGATKILYKMFVSFCFVFRTVSLRTRAPRMQHKSVNFKPAQ